MGIGKSFSYVQDQRQAIYFADGGIFDVVFQIATLTILEENPELFLVDHITFIKPDDIRVFQSFEVVHLPDDLFHVFHRISVELLDRINLALRRG